METGQEKKKKLEVRMNKEKENQNKKRGKGIKTCSASCQAIDFILNLKRDLKESQSSSQGEKFCEEKNKKLHGHQWLGVQ